MSKKTVHSEVEAINLILKVIDLVLKLHMKGIVHTNLCPEEIFLRDGKIDEMFFQHLYHCSWETEKTIGMYLPEDQDNLS